MKNERQIKSSETSRRIRPALSPEAEESQCIALASNLAKQQLMDGTASSQVIVHYLKMGSTKERIEREILSKQKDLIVAKTDALQSAKRVEELYANAMSAFRVYSGNGSREIDPDEEPY
jgi:hypothetical protein